MTNLAIKQIIPNAIYPGSRKKITIVGQEFERVVKYQKVNKIITQNVQNRNSKGSHTEEKLVEIDDTDNAIIHNPYVITNIDNAFIAKTEFKSSSVLEVNIEIPKDTQAGTYNIIVINPDGNSANTNIEILGIPDNKAICAKCGRFIRKPIELTEIKDMEKLDVWQSYICPYCGHHQGTLVYHKDEGGYII